MVRHPATFVQDLAMTDSNPYWPEGFLDDLDAHAGSDTDGSRIAAFAQHAAAELLQTELDDPARALVDERAKAAAFESRIAARWGRALDLFDLAVENAFAAGEWVNSTWRRAAAERQDQKFEALIRLHGRAVQTTREISVLLRSGYGTGAMARWRTLQEIRVVAHLLAENDQELSRRYLVHEVFDSAKAQASYEQNWEALQYSPPAPGGSAERAETEATLIAKFGAAFWKPNGWAAPLFNDRAPKLFELERKAGLGFWFSHYKMASHGVHANTKGIKWTIQALESEDVIWAGPSNSGLSQPAQCALIALDGVNRCLLSAAVSELMDEDDMENQAIALVRIQIVSLLREHAMQEFHATHRQQEDEEQRLLTLIDRITGLLEQHPDLSESAMADALEVDTDDLTHALEQGARRGLLEVQNRYRPRRDTPAPPTSG
jgi:hypothetical protein